MKLYRNLLLLAGLAAGTLAVSTMSPTSAQAANGAYCIAQSGANGENSFVSNCNYATYDQCLTATAGSSNGCVGNVDDSRNALAQMTSVRNIGRGR